VKRREKRKAIVKNRGNAHVSLRREIVRIGRVGKRGGLRVQEVKNKGSSQYKKKGQGNEGLESVTKKKNRRDGKNQATGAAKKGQLKKNIFLHGCERESKGLLDSAAG